MMTKSFEKNVVKAKFDYRKKENETVESKVMIA